MILHVHRKIFKITTFPNTNTRANKRQREKEEEIGKERANKTARVKWGRGKREANGK